MTTKTKPIVRLACWKAEEGKSRAAILEKAGYPVRFEDMDPGRLLAALKESPPAAVVIDLDRSPAAGRDLGVALRVAGATRHLPMVFAGGAPDKVEAVRTLLPDAGFASWKGIRDVLDRAMADPPAAPVVPDSVLAGYSGTPLPKKLGIKEGARVLLARAPDDISRTLGPLPAGVVFTRRYSKNVDLILWFVRSRARLEKEIELWASRVGRDGIWILWPKMSSEMASDLKQGAVREAGLSHGLVDYKIAALDRTWSGLKFARRK